MQITTDHNYFFQLNEMLRNGEIDREQYRIEAQEGEALISYVGMGGLQWKDISRAPFVLRPKDTILICSDGLYRSVPAQLILASVCCRREYGECCKLYRAGNTGGSKAGAG